MDLGKILDPFQEMGKVLADVGQSCQPFPCLSAATSEVAAVAEQHEAARYDPWQGLNRRFACYSRWEAAKRFFEVNLVD